MQTKIQYLENELQKSIEEHGSSRRRMFRYVRQYKYGITALGAISTIILGIQADKILGHDYGPIAKNIAFVIGVVVTVLTSLFSFWKIEEYWLQNKVLELELERLQKHFNFKKLGKGLNDEELDQLFAQLQEIDKKFSGYWESSMEEKLDKKKGENGEQVTE